VTEFMYSVGCRGVYAALIARRTAMQVLGGAWALGDGDIVTGKGHPTTGDLLYPQRPALDGHKPDADIVADLERLTPHLLRPVRLVSLAPKEPGLIARLTGKKKDPSERIDLGEHQAGKTLVLGSVPGLIEQCIFVDSQRLTVALARDFHARGGRFFHDDGPDAAYNLTDDRQYPENFEPRVAFLTRRMFREDYAYSLLCEDGMPFMVVPLNQDMLLVERAVGSASPDKALERLVVAYHAMFGLEMVADNMIEVTFHADGEEYSCVQHFREDEKFLTGLIKAIALPTGGSDPEIADMIDGRIEENYGQFANRIAANYSHLDAAYIRGLVARHGPLASDVLGECHRESDLGEDFGGGLFAREAKWMLDQEFARTADDIAARRGDFAWRGAEIERLQAWIDRGAPLR
jgi:hypothetical protein